MTTIELCKGKICEIWSSICQKRLWSMARLPDHTTPPWNPEDVTPANTLSIYNSSITIELYKGKIYELWSSISQNLPWSMVFWPGCQIGPLPIKSRRCDGCKYTFNILSIYNSSSVLPKPESHLQHQLLCRKKKNTLAIMGVTEVSPLCEGTGVGGS